MTTSKVQSATVARVWTTDACICCSACESALPEIFNCDEGQSRIRAEVRADGITDMNPTHVPLTSAAKAWSEEIIEAAAGCPTEAILVAFT